MAFVFSNTLNAQHKEGLDLKGLKGANLFISKGFELSQGMANLVHIFHISRNIRHSKRVVPTNITVRFDSQNEVLNAFNEIGTNLGSERTVLIFLYRINLWFTKKWR